MKRYYNTQELDDRRKETIVTMSKIYWVVWVNYLKINPILPPTLLSTLNPQPTPLFYSYVSKYLLMLILLNHRLSRDPNK